MKNRGHSSTGGRFHLLAYSGLVAIAGCAVQRQDPFAGVITGDRPAAVATGSSGGFDSSKTSTAYGPELRLLSPHVVTVSYQVPAPEERASNTQDGKSKNEERKLKKEDPQIKPAVYVNATRSSVPENLTADSKSSPGKLTFDQVIIATLLADNKIRAGLEAITQANADLRTSSLLPNPSLLTDGLLLPLRRFTPDQTGGPPQTDVLVSFPIDWFLFGKRVSAMANARLGVRQSESDYADLIRTRVRDAAVAYYDVLEAKGVLDLARQDADNLTKLEAANKKAVEAGGKPIIDLNRVRLDLLKSQQAMREAEAALVDAKARMRAFLGRSDSDPNFDLEGNLDAPLGAEPLPAEEAFTLAQENRPDIQSLRWQVSKAQSAVIVERRKALPQVTPQFGYTRQFQTAAIGQPDADSWNVALSTTLPVFDRNQGNRDKAESVEVQNRFNLQAGLVDLRSEVDQAVQDYRTAYQNAKSIAQDQLKLAREILDSITQAYEAGGRPLIDVLDSQRNYRETYRLFITSRANYWRSRYKLDAAIGKQIQPHDEQPR